MSRILSGKRPWLAALLAVLVTGLGHLYLRRWLRALGWMLFALTTAVLFVPTSALDTLAAGTPPSIAAIAPLLTVSLLSVVDAYLVGTRSALRSDANDSSMQCPACRRALDDDIDFCHWCTTPLADDAADGSE